MKVADALRATPRRVWVIAALVVVLVGVGVTVGVTVAANNAAAEQAAAEQAAAAQAAADQAAAEAAARLATAQHEADDHVSVGEALYAQSEPWSDSDDRTALRTALDHLIAIRADQDASADELEAATAAVTRTSASVGSPPAPVTLLCGNLDAGVNFAPNRLVLNPDGSGQYAGIWAAQVRCDTGMGGGSSIQKTVPVQTALQRAAVAAAKDAGYGQSGDTDAAILYKVYDGCAESGSGSYYSTATALSPAQAKEVEAWLTLCPDHPNAGQWRAAAGVGQAQQEAEAGGARVAPGGTYAVPSQMTTGSFVAENVTNCYWETRDANGSILDNDFVVAAPRVVADVPEGAVVFTTQGACGYWNRQ